MVGRPATGNNCVIEGRLRAPAAMAPSQLLVVCEMSVAKRSVRNHVLKDDRPRRFEGAQTVVLVVESRK